MPVPLRAQLRPDPERPRVSGPVVVELPEFLGRPRSAVDDLSRSPVAFPVVPVSGRIEDLGLTPDGSLAVHLLAFDGGIMGTYVFDEPHLAGPDVAGRWHISARPVMEGVPSERLWRLFQLGPDLPRYTWLGRSAQGQRHWASTAAQYTWARRLPIRADATVDCRVVDSEPALWCALGEALRGPGGYVGLGLDDLADEAPGHPPVTLAHTQQWPRPSSRRWGVLLAAIAEILTITRS